MKKAICMKEECLVDLNDAQIAARMQLASQGGRTSEVLSEPVLQRKRSFIGAKQSQKVVLSEAWCWVP